MLSLFHPLWSHLILDQHSQDRLRLTHLHNLSLGLLLVEIMVLKLAVRGHDLIWDAWGFHFIKVILIFWHLLSLAPCSDLAVILAVLLWLFNDKNWLFLYWTWLIWATCEIVSLCPSWNFGGKLIDLIIFIKLLKGICRTIRRLFQALLALLPIELFHPFAKLWLSLFQEASCVHKGSPLLCLCLFVLAHLLLKFNLFENIYYKILTWNFEVTIENYLSLCLDLVCNNQVRWWLLLFDS